MCSKSELRYPNSFINILVINTIAPSFFNDQFQMFRFLSVKVLTNLLMPKRTRNDPDSFFPIRKSASAPNVVTSARLHFP